MRGVLCNHVFFLSCHWQASNSHDIFPRVITDENSDGHPVLWFIDVIVLIKIWHGRWINEGEGDDVNKQHNPIHIVVL